MAGVNVLLDRPIVLRGSEAEHICAIIVVLNMVLALALVSRAMIVIHVVSQEVAVGAITMIAHDGVSVLGLDTLLTEPDVILFRVGTPATEPTVHGAILMRWTKLLAAGALRDVNLDIPNLRPDFPTKCIQRLANKVSCNVTIQVFEREDNISIRPGVQVVHCPA